MGRDKKVNPFAKKKRDKRNGKSKPDRRSEPYEEIVRENDSFYKYYKAQKICPDNEWEKFLNKIKDNLPTTFRITASKDEAKALLDIIKTEFFEEYTKAVSELRQIDGEEVSKPVCLPWYPDGLAWQLHLSRKDIRRSEPLYKLHNFLIAETNAGAINRQEAVSMIPPIVLDVKPNDKVLDMCAAPGSKTTQLIEALHSDNQENTIPSGFVVANDIDNNRCYMLVHQAKRLNSPCIVVTNHDSSFLPNMIKTNISGKKEILKFDKVLCDVPCSGDGTLRKNPDIWLKWNAAQGLNLHGVQYRIARRGAEQLSVGGRLVYSTCSLNPIENEAVLQRLVKDSNGALEIVDASHLVPGLKYKAGLTDWKLISRDIEIYTKWEEVPQKHHTVIRPNMFPLPPDEIKEIGLEKCMRVLPHMQDTGAFFVAALMKKKELDWEKNDSVEKTLNEMKANQCDSEMNKAEGERKTSAPWGPQRKKRRLDGYKEDPYVFFTENEPVWEDIKSFYELSDSFNKDCLLTRSVIGKKKNVYFCSPEIRDLVVNNEDSVKIINTGVKMFVRCDNRNMKCAFRLAQEGLNSSNPFIGKTRRLDLCRADLLKLLYCTDPTKPPPIESMTEDTQRKVEDIKPGSCILKYADKNFSISLVGWRGTTSLRAYIEQNDTIHVLRLLKADVSQFVVNKFKKSEESSPEVTEGENEKKTESVDDFSNNKSEESSPEVTEGENEKKTESVDNVSNNTAN